MYIPHNIISFFNNKELNELYATIAIRTFAGSLIGIFIPIFLLELNNSLTEVFLFFVVFHGVHVLFSIPSAHISSLLGTKHTILLSIPLYILGFLGLYSMEYFGWPSWLIASIFGLNSALFWHAYHADFAKITAKGHRGKDVAISRVAFSLPRVAGPAIGGIIIVLTNFQILFIVTSALLLFATIPLFMSRDIYIPTNFSLKKMLVDESFRDFIAFCAVGMLGGVNLVVWPLFIYTAIEKSTATVGFVASLALVFSLISALSVGAFSRKRRVSIFRISSIGNSVMLIAKSFIATAKGAFALDAIHGGIFSAVVVPFEAISYRKASKTNIMEFTAFRELSMNLGRCILFVALIFVSNLKIGLLLGAVASLLVMLF